MVEVGLPMALVGFAIVLIPWGVSLYGAVTRRRAHRYLPGGGLRRRGGADPSLDGRFQPADAGHRLRRQRPSRHGLGAGIWSQGKVKRRLYAVGVVQLYSLRVQTVCLGHTCRSSNCMMRGVGRWPAKTPRRSAWQGRGEGVGVRRAIPVGPEASSVERPLNGARAMRSAPQRFVETWIDAIVGFLFCVVLPIPIYATGEPFAAGLGRHGVHHHRHGGGLFGRVVLRPPARRLSARHPAGQHRLRRADRRSHLRPDRRHPAVAAHRLFARPVLRLGHPDPALDGGRGAASLALPDPQLRGDAALLHRRHAGPRDLPMARFRRCAEPRHARRRHRRRSQRRSRRGTGSPPWRTPRSPACRCSIGATSSRR